MGKWLLTILLASLAAPAAAVPSGQPLALWQVSWERIADTRDLQLVIRAIAPEVGARGFEVAQGDMDWICATHGLTLTALPHASAAQVVVNLMDKPVPRGVADPNAAQFFSVYRVENGACISEDV